jgi:hypothetical protein
MAWDLSNNTWNSSPLLKNAWATYTPQRRKLAVNYRAAHVKPVFEKLAIGTGAPVRLVPLTGEAYFGYVLNEGRE